eukprot:2348313-Prymnesium_polylepis.1
MSDANRVGCMAEEQNAKHHASASGRQVHHSTPVRTAGNCIQLPSAATAVATSPREREGASGAPPHLRDRARQSVGGLLLDRLDRRTLLVLVLLLRRLERLRLGGFHVLPPLLRLAMRALCGRQPGAQR